MTGKEIRIHLKYYLVYFLLIGMALLIGLEMLNDLQEGEKINQGSHLILVVLFVLIVSIFTWLFRDNRKLREDRNFEKTESEKKESSYKYFLENAGDPIFIVGENSKILEANLKACEFLGYTKQELLHMGLSDIIAPENLLSRPLEWEKLKQDKSMVIERTLKRKDEIRVYVEVNARELIGQQYFIIARDITQRKANKKQLIFNEEKFRLSFMTGQDAFYLATLEGGMILEINPVFKKLFGYSEEEIIGKKSLDLGLYHIPEERNLIVKELKSTGSVKEREITGRKKSGELIDLLMSISVFSIDDQNFILGVLKDITERKKIEKELIENKERLRAVYNSIPMPTYTWQRVEGDFVLIDFNQAAVTYTNNSIQGLKGVKASELYTNKREFYGNIEKCYREKCNIEQEAEYQFFSSNKQAFLNVKYAFVSPDLVLVHTEDISIRKSIENKLNERSEQLAIFIEHSPAALAMLDTEMKYISTSRRWYSDYGIKEQSILGKSHYEIFPEIREEWKNIHQHCLKGNSAKQDEDVFKRADGSLNWVKWEILPWYKSEGEIGGIVMLTEVITERKLAEINLRKSEERYHKLVSDIHVGVVLSNSKAEALVCNQRACELLGLNQDQILHKTSYDPTWKVIRENGSLVSGDEHPIPKCISSGRPVLNEVMGVFRPSIGDYIWLLVNANPQFDELGNLKEVITTFEDISFRILAEKKIRESEIRFRNLNDNLLVGVYIINQEFKLTYGNKKLAEMYGYSQEELIGTNALNYIHPEDQAFILDNLQKRMSGEPGFSYSYRGVRKDGEIRLFEVNGSRLLMDEELVLIGNVLDVTDKKRIEQKIQESEEKYRYLFENNPSFIIVWDLEKLKVLEVNDAVVSTYGYSKEEWNNMSVFTYRPIEDHSKIKSFANHMLHTNERIAKRVWKHYKKNGEEMIMEIASHKITYQNRPAILSLGRDVTDQIIAENALRKSEDKYHSIINHAADAIFMLTSDGIIFDANEAASEIFQIDQFDIKGKNAIDFLFVSNSGTDQSQWQKLLTNRSFKFESRFKRQDHTVVEVEISCKVLPDENNIIAIVRDITQRNNALRKIKESEERIFRIMQNSPVPLVLVSSNQNTEFVNNEFIKTFGYNLHDIPTSYAWRKMAYPDDHYRELVQQQWVERLERFKNNEELYEPLEATVCCKDGSLRIIEFHYSNLGNEFLISFHDITERKQIEKYLVQSEEKQRALVENISDTIILVNEKLNIVYQSPAFIRTAGISKEELAGKTILTVIHPDNLESCKNLFSEANAKPGTPLPFQYRIRHKLGHYIWIEGTLNNLLEDDAVLAYIINYRDVTQRKNYEEQLALSASIVNSSDDAIISKTLDGIITSWNRGAERVLGYSAKEVIGQSISLIVPADLKSEELKINARILKGKYIDHYETLRIRKDGELLNVSLTISPIRNELNQIIGSSKIMRDITESKKLENEKQKIMSDLLQRNRDLEQFSYIVSHNLRLPVSNIMGISDYMINFPVESGEREQLNLGLSKSVHALDNVIRDLNFILQMKREVSEMKTKIKFSELVEDIKLSIANLISDSKVAIHVNFDELNEILTLKSYLYSILYNLISNAIKFKRNDVEPEVWISSARADNKVILTVKDNGLGIDIVKRKDQIFGLYRRFHSHTEGKGMGLYMVKMQVETLGGKISVDSEVNKGTEFRIEFDLSAKA